MAAKRRRNGRFAATSIHPRQARADAAQRTTTTHTGVPATMESTQRQANDRHAAVVATEGL